jgi:hypothetical protein
VSEADSDNQRSTSVARRGSEEEGTMNIREPCERMITSAFAPLPEIVVCPR